MVRVEKYVKDGKLVLTVYTAANAIDDWYEVGELVRGPFWGDRYPDRLEFKPNGAWLNTDDLIKIAEYITAYKAK